MISILELLKSLISFITKNTKLVLSIAVVIAILLLLQQCNATRKANEEKVEIQKQAAQNDSALVEKMQKVTNKNGQTSYQKAILDLNVSDLQKINPSLYNSIKAEAGKPKIIIQIQTVYKDTGSVKNTLVSLGNDNYDLDFDYISKDSVLSIKGKTSFNADPYMIDKTKGTVGLHITPWTTDLYDSEIKFGLTTGIKTDKNGISKIFVTPNSKNISILSIDGADVTSLLSNNTNNKKNVKNWGAQLYAGTDFNKTSDVIKTLLSLGAAFDYQRFSISPYVKAGFSFQNVNNSNVTTVKTYGISTRYNFVKF